MHNSSIYFPCFFLNSIERAVLLSDDESIGVHNLTLEGRAEGESVMAGDTMNLG